ncbi:MAG: VWA domain-containing protein [Clostridiales Family XIII bacterium]|jgi:hypothetical protein|nr:VWA domain-containing protein [Clostridiales Family XIII bacterium]
MGSVKPVRIVCLAIMLFLITATPYCFAVSESESLDIVFVADCSGSMRTGDAENSVKELIALFAAVSNDERVRIGVVGYSDRIVVSLPPQNLSTDEGKESLDAALSALVPNGNTDIGLGLAQARALFDESDHSRTIILLSDGETYMGRSGRGEEVSALDAEETLAWAKQNAVPVHCVAVGDYDGGTDIIERLSRETGGLLCKTGDFDVFSDILETVLVPVMKSPLTRIAEGRGTGGGQEVRIDVPHDQADALNVILYSGLPASGLQAERNGLTEDVLFYGGAKYGNVSIKNPKSGEYSVKFTVPQGAPFLVYTMYAYTDMRCELTLEDLGDVAVSARLTAKNRSEPVNDVGFYESLNASVSFTGTEGAETEIPMSAEGEGLYAEYRPESPGIVNAEARSKSLVFSGAISGVSVSVAPIPDKEFPTIPVLIGLTLACLCVALFMLFRKKPVVPILQTQKYPYAGKLIVYIMRSASGAEYPPFTFVLSGIGAGAPIPLRSVLRFSLDDDLGISEAGKILFSPGPDHGLVFRHDTSQTITLGPLVTIPGESYIIDYGAKLYLLLQSGGVELEIHYRQAGPKEEATYRLGDESA